MLIGILACSLGFHAITFETGLATSVGIFGKPGPHVCPSCYFYCLHRARNGQNLSHAYLHIGLVFTP